MSFREFEDAFIWRCDHCGLSAEFPPKDFWGALGELKARGWRFERSDEWSHSCGQCRRKQNAEAATLMDRPVGLRKVWP